MGAASEARQQISQNIERLGEVADSTAELSAQASSFAAMAKQVGRWLPLLAHC